MFIRGLNFSDVVVLMVQMADTAAHDVSFMFHVRSPIFCLLLQKIYCLLCS